MSRRPGAVALTAAVALGAAVLLGACSGPGPTAGPHSVFMSLKGQGAALMTLEVADAAGIVARAAQRREGERTALAAADATAMDRAGLVVRALPGSDGILVDWTSGACDTQQRMTLARAADGRVWVVLDRGTPSDPACDASLLTWEVAISTRVPVEASAVGATTAPTAAP